MKHALDVYEELKRRFSEYALSDWLRLPDGAMTLAFDLINLNAAAAFFFDRLFAKENAGAKKSPNCAQERFDGDAITPKPLSDVATELFADETSRL
jgi:hypothetical protein